MAQLDVIGIVVKDIARALAFYRQLGIEIPADADKERHVEAGLSGGMKLAWDTWETMASFHPDWQPASGGPNMSLAFRCDSPADVNATYERLVSMGYHGEKAPWDAFWGQRYALMHDPDGNGVDLYAPLS